MEKHFLASANSCNGFINLFKNINPDKNSFTYILKGGPGTGKSSVMKMLANTYKNKGYDIEYFYCSSDPESLDGVKICKKNIAIVDGTAPHITEATIPGVKEKIINVGEFIKPQIKKHKNTIEKLLIKKKQNFEKAYETLRATSHLINIENITNFKVNNLNLKEKFSLIPQKHCGSERKLFCSFITKNGIENFYYKNKFKNIEVLPFNFFENALLLENLSKMLKENNFNFISFMSPLNPTLREAIYIEETKTIVYAFNINENLLESFKNKTIIQKLLKQAGSYIERAKYYHKKIEVYYVKNMDFDGLKKYINNIENRL